MDSGGTTKQKGIVHWGISPNRQNPFAGAGHAAVFNTFRRTKSQIFYWLPAMVTGYYLMHWAIERYAQLETIWTVQRLTCAIGTSTSTPRLDGLSLLMRRNKGLKEI